MRGSRWLWASLDLLELLRRSENAGRHLADAGHTGNRLRSGRLTTKAGGGLVRREISGQIGGDLCEVANGRLSDPRCLEQRRALASGQVLSSVDAFLRQVRGNDAVGFVEHKALGFRGQLRCAQGLRGTEKNLPVLVGHDLGQLGVLQGVGDVGVQGLLLGQRSDVLGHRFLFCSEILGTGVRLAQLPLQPAIHISLGDALAAGHVSNLQASSRTRLFGDTLTVQGIVELLCPARASDRAAQCERTKNGGQASTA